MAHTDFPADAADVLSLSPGFTADAADVLALEMAADRLATLTATRDAVVLAVTRRGGAAVAWGLANTSPSDVYGLRIESIALGGEEWLLSDEVASALGALDTSCHTELAARRAVSL